MIAGVNVAVVLRPGGWRLARLPRGAALRLWLRRGGLAAVLVGLVIFPGRAPSGAASACSGTDCPGNGVILWSAALGGSWQVSGGINGTVPSQGQAYVGFSGGVAAIGLDLSVAAYDARTGDAAWATLLTGYPAGSAITSVRVWPGVVTVGVMLAGGPVGPVGAPAGGSGDVAGGREEVVLDATDGAVLASFPASDYGGAVSASRQDTVIIGPGYVTCYRNRTGRPIWRVPVGADAQAWRVDGTDLYLTISAQGVVGTAPVTAVRQISLLNGTQRLIRPPAGPFVGSLVGVTDGLLLFAGADGLTGYSVQTGLMNWHRAGRLYVGNDPVQHVLYVDAGATLAGLDPADGKTRPGMWLAGPAGTYGVRNGIALGLDSGPGGAVWGYALGQHRVIWTSASLPWPHYYVDLSGLGGSSNPGSDVVLLVACGKTGAAASVGTGTGLAGAPACLKPELVAIAR